jgi:AGCS family alanine or glycine:cation symporter
LGGTVGVGSITGIGYAFAVGGVGSIFWMWVSSFFGMGIKYAETYIAVKYKNKKTGGAMVALKSLGYSKTGVAFAILVLISSLGGGNSAQSASLASAFSSVGVSPYIVAVVSCVLLYLVLFGGKKRIEKVNSYLVPLATVLYIFSTLFILVKTGNRIPNVLNIIVKDAFGIKQVGGGVSAYLFSRSVRMGVVRGVFSHEAGMGSSPIAHACAVNSEPHIQGLLGIAEIYVDTFIVGTLTAFCLACNDTYSVSELFLRFFGSIGGVIFAFFMAVFAFAAVLSWCYYSEACLRFLLGEKNKAFGIYKFFAIGAFAVGCVAPMGISWGASDILNCLMIYPNLFLIFLKRKEIICCGGKENTRKILVGEDRACFEASKQ